MSTPTTTDDSTLYFVSFTNPHVPFKVTSEAPPSLSEDLYIRTVVTPSSCMVPGHHPRKDHNVSIRSLGLTDPTSLVPSLLQCLHRPDFSHTYTHTYTRTYTYILLHTYVHTCKCIYVHLHTCSSTRPHTHLRTHTYTRGHTHIRTHTCTLVPMHVYLHLCS